MFGVEIEFIVDKEKLFETLKQHNIPFIYYDKQKTETHNIIVIKKEITVKGLEINFPPSNDFELIKKVLSILDVKFNERCACHIHVDASNYTIEDLNKLHNYYFKHQEQIINEAKEKGLYLDLNEPLYERINLIERRKNLNIFPSFNKHGTIEHRIYKATTNYNDVLWCIEQTLNIINNFRSDL